MDTNTLISLALISSGTKENKQSAYAQKIQRFLKNSENGISSSMREKEKSEYLLKYMHSNLLKRYELTQTRVDTVMDSGRYNCVSSAMLYMILTRYHGIITKGIHSADHAFCYIPGRTQAEDIDVETTSEWGFDPGSKKEFESSFTNRTGYIYVPPGNYSQRSVLGDRDMAGLIFQNRIVELQRKGNHLEALTLGADRYALTASAQAKSDYFDTVQNAAAMYNSQGQYQKGIEIIETAYQGSPDLPDFLLETRKQLIFNACGSYINQNKPDDAERLLRQYASVLKPSDQKELESLIIQRRLEILVKEPYSEQTMRQIKSAMDKGSISQNRAKSLGAYHYSIQADQYSRKGKHIEAYDFMNSAPLWIQADREYKRILNIIENNAAIEYHNQIVQFLNKGDSVKAQMILDDALAQIPGNSILLQDKQRLSR